MIFRRFPLVLALLMLFSVAQGQVSKPVKWSSQVKKVSDTEADIILTATIDQKYHLYSQYNPVGGSNPLIFTFEPSGKYIKVGKVLEYPKPTELFEPVFNVTEKFFTNKAYFTQRIKVLGNKTFPVTINISGQTCNDFGCDFIDIDFTVNIDGSQYNKEKPVDTTAIKAATEPKKETPKPKPAEVKPAQDGAFSGSLWSIIIEAIIWGFVALLTPCVFPMVPMTVSFFLKGSENKAKSRFNASVFGISIVALYTIPIAILIGVTYFVGGDSVTADIFNFLSTHWIPNIIFFLIFIIFAASFFGAFEIVLPSWMTSKADSKADRGGFIGSFFMALTLVLVSFSCTGPIVGTIIVKSTQGEIWEPIITMLAFSTAFALPFTLLAFFPSWMKNLPKSGGWLNSVKVVLGFIEVALAFKFLMTADQAYHWGLLDREIYLAIWIVTFALLGFYLLGKLKFKHDSEVPYLSVGRLALSITVFSFVVYMIPGMWGAPLKALSGYMPPMQTQDFDMQRMMRETVQLYGGGSNDSTSLCEKPKFEEVFDPLPHGLKGYHDFDQALRCAKQQNKPLFIDFTGHGCNNCREMEANVWSNPEVLKRLMNDYIVVALYVDDKTELPEAEWVTSTVDGKVKKTIGRKFADLQVTRYNQSAQPYYALVDTEGKDLVSPRGYNLNVEDYIRFLDDGLKEFKARQKK